MKYSILKNEVYKNRLSETAKKYGLFFAFDEKQLKAGLKETNTEKHELINMAGGGYISKKNVKKYIDEVLSINTWFVSEVKKLDPVEVIRYELNNYECYLSGEVKDAYEVLQQYGFSLEEVEQVFNNEIIN